MTGPVNVKQISTLNVKSGRPGKCEKKSTLNVKKSLVSCITSQMVSLDNLVGLVSFFGIFQKLKILGSVMILKECKSGHARGHFLGVLDVKNKGGHLRGVWVRHSKIYRK